MRGSLARRIALPLLCAAVGLAAAQSQPPTSPPGMSATGMSAAGTDPFRGSPPAPAGVPVYITAHPDVIIPFTVRTRDAQGRAPAKVRVYVSIDQGQKWELLQDVKSEEKGFRFKAKKDAEFWFATQTINADGTGDRDDARLPQMKLIVDTTKPRVQIVPKLDEQGRLQLSWAAADPNLAPTSVKLEWQDSASGTWQEVTPANKPAVVRGQFAAHGLLLPIDGVNSIVLRGEAADSAGNRTVVSHPFELKPAGDTGKAAILPSAPGQGALAQQWRPEDNDPFQRQPSTRGQRPLDPALPRARPERELAAVGSNTLPSPGSTRGSSEQEPAPQLVRNPYSSASSIPARPANTGELLPPGGELLPPPQQGAPYSMNESSNSQREAPSLTGPLNEAPRQESPRQEVLPGPERIDAMPTAPPRRVEPLTAPAGDRPRMTANNRFSLDYDIEAVGPEGVAEVELWGTTDRGKTWMKWGLDPDRASPFEVEVSSEATYGFRIVIIGKNGLASNTPQSGDAADIWIGVDLAKPHVRLTGATIAGGEQAGKLAIRWEAADEHFGPRPITLSVSDRAAGPFTPIAAGLPNSGSYYWEFDPRLRRQLYLRIEAMDEAGNFSSDQLTDPILIEGLAPKGRIRDLAPAPNAPPSAFRSPLFR